jgi:hypothetical protein
MARKPDGSDRDIPPAEIDNLDPATLRALLERGDAAQLFDAETRARIGRLIAEAARTPPPPVAQPQQQQQQQQRTEPEPGEDAGSDPDTP